MLGLRPWSASEWCARRAVRAGLVAVAGVLLALGLTALAACSSTKPTAPASWDGFAEVYVSSPLLRLLSQEVEVRCRIVAEQADQVASVQADLAQIGGAAAQPLARLDDRSWGWTGHLVPSQNGERTVTFRAALNDGAAHAQTDTVLVHEPGEGDGPPVVTPNAPPVVTQEVASTTGVVGVHGAATVSCTASDLDGTVVRVVADMTAVGGLRSAALTRIMRPEAAGEPSDTWRWEGELAPLQVGDLTIPITATDDDGATGAGQALLTVGPGYSLVVTPDSLEIDIFDAEPRTFTAVVTPAPPAGTEVVYHWSTGTFVGGTLQFPGIFADSPGLDRGSMETEESAARFMRQPQPWHWSMRLPIGTVVRCGATLTLPVGVAEASGGRAHATISQRGLEVVVGFQEEVIEYSGGAVLRHYEAGFEWPLEGASVWVVAFLSKPGEEETKWNGMWVLSQVTVANGEKTLVDAGNGGLLLERNTWRSESGIALQNYLDQCERTRRRFADWRAKVTAWPPTE